MADEAAKEEEAGRMAEQGVLPNQAVPGQIDVGRESLLTRIAAEMAQGWAIAVKDVRVYFLTPPMVMFGLAMPFFMFFSFSVGRNMSPEVGIVRLLAIASFFTASSVGPVILPMEKRIRTYDRLLVAPVSLVTVILGKCLVGTFFGLVTSVLPLLFGMTFFHMGLANPLLVAIGLVAGSLAFSVLGVLFASLPADNPGAVMMPSTLIRWPLLFISGIFIPLPDMEPWARAISYISPLTYTQDLFNHAVLGAGVQNLALDLGALVVCLVAFIIIALKLHDVSRRLGY